MSWAKRAIDDLKDGKETFVTPHGNSMRGLVESGETVKLRPIDNYDSLKPQDIVLVRVRGNVYLHLIHAISNNRFLIGNNCGHTNGWVGKHSIYGIKV